MATKVLGDGTPLALGASGFAWKEVSVDVEAEHREPVRVAVVAYRGDFYADVRHMYTNKAGELAYTPRGVRVPVQDMGNLIASLLRAMCISGDLTLEEALEVVTRSQ